RARWAGRREPGGAHGGEEAPSKVGVTDGPGRRGAEDGPAPAAAELSDATGQHLLGGPAVAHRRADRGGQLPLVDAGGDVDDRAGPARQVETSHRDDVGTGEDLRRVYPGQRRPRPTTTRHGQLDGSGAEAVETEQAGGGEMRHDGLVTNGQHRRLHGPLPRRLVPGKAVHALAEVVERTGGDATVELAGREAGGDRLACREQAELVARHLSQELIWSHAGGVDPRPAGPERTPADVTHLHRSGWKPCHRRG